MAHLLVLKGACLANSVPIDGDYETLRTRLGHALVDKMLQSGDAPAPTSSPSASASANGKRPVDATIGGENLCSKKARHRCATKWHAFLRIEKQKVKQAFPHLKGHALITEVARRWRLHKQALNGSAPLMITDATGSSTPADSESVPSKSEAVAGMTLDLLEFSSPQDINTDLQQLAVEVDKDPKVNAFNLANKLVEL